jgi:hypothetical protein
MVEIVQRPFKKRFLGLYSKKMKFAQFEDRKKYLREIEECVGYLNRYLWNDQKKAEFIEVPRLNLILRRDSSVNLFLSVTKEYRSHQDFGKRLLAFSYIGLIALLLKLKLSTYFFNVLILDVSEFYPVILGGNNRLRFIDSSNSDAILISKNTNSDFFTNNAISAYQHGHFYNLDVIPPILPITGEFYLEKQVDGLAINRFSLSDSERAVVNNSLSSLFIIQEELCSVVSLEVFLKSKVEVLINYSSTFKSEKNSELIKLFFSITEQVERYFGDSEVKITPSHGDLNRGNVFYGQNKVSIIDWEYYMYRYIDYDKVIYMNNLRHKSLSDYSIFMKQTDKHNFDTVIFLVEELLFRILNFKLDILDSQMHIDEISYLIKQNISKGVTT